MKQQSIQWWHIGIILLVTTLASIQTPAHARPDRPIIAFYSSDYGMGHWTYDGMSDQPAPVYSSSDGDAIMRHIEQAHSVGIDAFICTVHEAKNPDDGRCRSVQRRIEKSGYDFKIVYMPDISPDADAELRTPEGLAKVLQTLKDEIFYRPSYWHYQGKPAVFFMNPNYFGSAEEWRRFRNQVDLYREMYWFVGTDIPSLEDDVFTYLATGAFDAVYPYHIAKDATPYQALSTYAYRLQQHNAAHATDAPFVGMVMPGYDDMRSNAQGYQRDRQDGQFYRESWNAIRQYNPSVIILNSFNNFFNGTAVEPSEVYGTFYLDLTRDLIQNYAATVPQQASDATYFSQTGHFLRGSFRSYWQQQGGLQRFGYPITEEYTRQSDGKLVQFFERARFELRVVNNQAYIDLGLIGSEYADMFEAAFQPEEPVATTAVQRYFPETRHSLKGYFKAYWETNGDVAFIGYPISDELIVLFPDGRQRKVQYFERARLELHDGTVLLGLLGPDLAPCALLPAVPADHPPTSPITSYDKDPCVKEHAKDNTKNDDDDAPMPSVVEGNIAPSQAVAPVARGRVYPSVVQPSTVQGFEAWDFLPGETVSLWFNMPDGTTRSLPYVATADDTGYVLIGIQTQRIDPEGAWSLVGKGMTSNRVVVAPFELRW